MRIAIFCLLFLMNCALAVSAQEPQQTADTVEKKTYRIIAPPQAGNGQVLDSVILATQARQKFVQDSIALRFIRVPDSAMTNQAARAFLKEHLYSGFQFLDIPFKSKNTFRDGHVRQPRDPWVIMIVVCLLLYTAMLNLIMHKDVRNVVFSLYDKRASGPAGKEDTQINFWAFAGLFLLFGLTFGLFLYQLAVYKGVYYSVSGVRLFSSFVVIILLLFAAKFLILRAIGFIFDIKKMVSEYVSVLYMTYFNIGFVFLPVTICFTLLAAQFIPVLLFVAVTLIVVIFAWLYVRSSVNIISNFRFHKFYLFIYLCALEICPVLILIKALNI